MNAFKLQGIDGFETGSSQFKRILKLVLDDESISIVFIQEDLYLANREMMDKIKGKRKKPLFVEIPLTTKGDDKPDIIADIIKRKIGIAL
ncbi:MAG: V-type ATP synthase subunit F [Promethearchaeota archaeon]